MRFLPLLSFVVVLYAVLALLGGTILTAALLTVTLPSTAAWSLTLSDVVVAVGLVLLFVEVLKSTRTSAMAALDHGLSLLVMIATLVGFLLVPALGTSTFFLIFLMTLIDVVAGFAVSLIGARRDIGYTGGPGYE